MHSIHCSIGEKSMPDNLTIVDLSNLSKPADTLIKKIASATGTLYEPTRIRRKAKADVDAAKIAAVGEIDLEEIQQRGLERFVHNQTRKQENVEAIALGAIRDLPDDANVEDLDIDWLANFFEKCENFSDNDMQSMWSKLLSGEATQPGIFSKRTVNFVASMDKSDAELFTSFCSFVVSGSHLFPLVWDEEDQIYQHKDITFVNLKHLESIGLIQLDLLSGFDFVGMFDRLTFHYFNIHILVTFEELKENKLMTGKSMLTHTGSELIRICGAGENPDFVEYLIGKFNNQKGVKSVIGLDRSTKFPSN